MPAKVVDASALAAVIFSEPEARRLRPALERISCFLHNSCASRLPTFAGRSSGSIPTDATLSWRRRDARSDGCILPLAGPRARRRVGDSRRRPGRAVRLKPRQDHPARPAHSRRGRGPAGRGTVRSQDRPCGPQIPERRLPAQRQADRRRRHGSLRAAERSASGWLESPGTDSCVVTERERCGRCTRKSALPAYWRISGRSGAFL